MVGHYLPAVTPKKVELNKERIEYWISQGAQPTDTVAALLKRNGFEGMDKFLEPRNKQKKKKGEQPEETPAPEAAKAEAAPAAEAAPVEEKKEESAAEAPKEEAKEEAPAEEKKEETPAPEAAA